MPQNTNGRVNASEYAALTAKPRQRKSDIKSASRKRATKKVSVSSPKFLGRTSANVKIQQKFPSRDPKFRGRTKSTPQKMAMK